MTDSQQSPDPQETEQGLFKKYPKLQIIIIAFIAYGLLFGMCAIVGVLLLRG